jgi:hypothetical protein
MTNLREDNILILESNLTLTCGDDTVTSCSLPVLLVLTTSTVAPTAVLWDATGVCIPTGNTEMFLASAYKSPQRQRSDTDITELLNFRNASILASDLNAKHSVWSHPCGGGVEYLHRDPASRRRRRKGKTQI